MCIIDRSAAFRDLDMAPALERREQHEQICRAVALVLVVVACLAIIFNPDLPGPSVYMSSLETAARSLKVVPIAAPLHSDAEIEAAIIALGRESGGGLVVMADTFTLLHRAPIIS